MLPADVIAEGVAEVSGGAGLAEAVALGAVLASLGAVVVVVVVVVVEEFPGAAAVVAGAILLASLFSSRLQPATDVPIATALAAINNLRVSIMGSCIGCG